MPTYATSSPGGYGGSSGVPSTACLSGTAMRVSRPGRASPGAGRSSFLRADHMEELLAVRGSTSTTRRGGRAFPRPVPGSVQPAGQLAAAGDVPQARLRAGSRLGGGDDEELVSSLEPGEPV